MSKLAAAIFSRLKTPGEGVGIARGLSNEVVAQAEIITSIRVSECINVDHSFGERQTHRVRSSHDVL